MTPSVFKITPTPPTSIKLEPGQEGRLSFTVESLAAPDEDHAVMLQALLVVDGGRGKPADWLGVDPPGTRSMPGGKTETVSIIARPTPSSPRGENSIKLVVADRDRPNDVYTDSPSVVCEVSAAAGVGTSPPRKPPRWLIPVIMGGLLLVGVVALILGNGGDEPSHGRPGLGEACGSEPDRACGERLLCVDSKCLLAGGARCQSAQATLCASGECESKTAVCAIPFGGACNPGGKDQAPCPKDGACDPATKTCLRNVAKAPAVKAGAPCEGTCPDPLRCNAVTKRCVAPIGQPCTENDQCFSGLCEGELCAKPQLLRNCTTDKVCDVDQKCVEFQSKPQILRCTWQPGHPCTSKDECSSGWCNQGHCSRDDGGCRMQSDCPEPYECVIAQQRCLMKDNGSCTENAACSSGYCKDKLCAPSPCRPGCPSGYYCDVARAKCESWGIDRLDSVLSHQRFRPR